VNSSEQDPIPLLVLTRHAERAEAINTLLRNQGVWSRIRSIDSFEALAEEEPSDWTILIWDPELDWNWASLPEDLQQKWEALPRLSLLEQSPGTWPGTDFISLDDAPKARQIIQQTAEFSRLKRDALQLRYTNEEGERAHRLLAETLETPLAFIQEGLHLYANPAYLTLFGLDSPESRSFLDLFPAGERTRIKQALKKCSQASVSRPVEFEVQQRGGPLQLVIRPLSWAGEPAILILARRPDSPPPQTPPPEAVPDPKPAPVPQPQESGSMEGLVTNTDFTARVQEHLEAALPKRSEQAIGVIQLRDLPRLLNEHGTAMIGSLLDEIERHSRAISRPGDLVTRFGWTLCYWLERPAGENMEQWAEQLHRAVDGKLYEAWNRSLVIGLVIGLSSRVRSSTLERLVQEATQASQGPQPVNRYLPTATASDPQDLATVIDHMIERKKLPLVRRTISSFTTGDSLIRFELRLGSSLLETCHCSSWPDFFRRVSEQGALAVLDQHLLDSALGYLLHPPQPEPFTLYLRLSGETLKNSDMARSIAERWPQQTPGRLALLFHERSIANQIKTAREWIGPLRAAGILIGLDEFGQSSYSGLMLNHFKPNLVRMPASRLLEADSPPEVEADDTPPAETAAPWLSVLRERKIPILATDVDRAQLLNDLLLHGVLLAQGSFFGEDLPIKP
jgi:EAL domain-containing protein (putative c-di-GMP-specific phosphodiesterase class I)/PAS domain-containing protein